MDEYSDDENNSSSSDYDSDESYETEDHNIKQVIGSELIGGSKEVYDDEDDEDENNNDDDVDEVDDDVNNDDVYNKQPDILSRNNFNNYEDDSDEDTDENYLQKLNNNLNQNYIVDFHPECLTHNYDEITILTSVVSDSNNIIIDNLHRTIPFLTKYEKARILGQRAKQINYGAKPLIKIPENIIDGYVIAELELQQKKIPFIIRRPLPGGCCEYWNVKDLENISF
jgi:DNA-directed RNA polymerase I, II, and III subunit RPABC2